MRLKFCVVLFLFLFFTIIVSQKIPSKKQPSPASNAKKNYEISEAEFFGGKIEETIAKVKQQEKKHAKAKRSGARSRTKVKSGSDISEDEILRRLSIKRDRQYEDVKAQNKMDAKAILEKKMSAGSKREQVVIKQKPIKQMHNKRTKGVESKKSEKKASTGQKPEIKISKDTKSVHRKKRKDSDFKPVKVPNLVPDTDTRVPRNRDFSKVERSKKPVIDIRLKRIVTEETSEEEVSHQDEEFMNMHEKFDFIHGDHETSFHQEISEDEANKTPVHDEL